MAKKKDSPTKADEKRLTKHALQKELMAQARAKPHILSAEEYEEWLNHTVLARLERGEQALDQVRMLLQNAALNSNDATAEELHLVIEIVDRAIIAFQYAPLKFNVMYMPNIDDQPVMNPILWEMRRKDV